MRNFGGQAVRFCPHFKVDEHVACSAGDGRQYRPSEFQQKEYCTASNYPRCPLFMIDAPAISAADGGLPRSDR